MAVANSRLAVLPDDQRRLVESWLAKFDRAWNDAQLDRYARKLPAPPSPVRLPALIEMVKIDLQRQWQRGGRVLLDEYLHRYPELGDAAAVPADLVQAEHDVRQHFGAAPEPAEYQRRFPRQTEALGLTRQRTAAYGATPPAMPPAAPAPDTARAQDTTPPSGPQHADRANLPEQFGRYRVVRKLGQGGMGAVYLAHDTQLDRPVALKVPFFDQAAGADVLERFRREARTAATLQHPNICPVFDVGEIDGVPYLSMAYIDGKPLSDYVKPGRPLPPLQVAALVRKLALALKEAHNRGIIHRDLKPANIMINERKEPVIMDFGLARQFDKADSRLTKTGFVMGTPGYMPPEQVSGNVASLGPAWDIYSLGVIMYELLTTCLPFRGDTPLAVFAKVLTEEAEPPVAHRPDLDPRLNDICRKAMAKKAADRYASMGELAAALADYVRGESAAVTGSPAATPTAAARTDTPFVELEPAYAGARQRMPKAWWWAVGGSGALALVGLVVVLLRTATSTATVESSDPPAPAEIRADNKTSDAVAAAPEPSAAKSANGDTRSPASPELKPARAPNTIDRTPVYVPRPANPAPKKNPSAGRPPPSLPSPKPRPQQIAVLEHASNPSSCALSSDGKFALTGARDGSVRFWQLGKDRPIWKPDGHNMPVTAVAFFRDQYAVSAGDRGDQTLRLWDLKARKQLWRFPVPAKNPTGLQVAIVSPKGNYAVTGGVAHNTCYLLNAGTGAVLGRFPTKTQCDCAAFSPNEEYLVIGDSKDDALHLWDVRNLGKVVDVGPLAGRPGVIGVAFSADGRTISAAYQDGTLRCWSVPNRVEIRKREVRLQSCNHVDFSPDGRRALVSGLPYAAAKKGVVVLMDLMSGTELHRFDDLKGRASSVAFSLNGTTVAFANGTSVRVFQLIE